MSELGGALRAIQVSHERSRNEDCQQRQSFFFLLLGQESMSRRGIVISRKKGNKQVQKEEQNETKCSKSAKRDRDSLSSVPPPQPLILRFQPLVLLPQLFHLPKMLLEQPFHLPPRFPSRLEHIEMKILDLGGHGVDQRRVFAHSSSSGDVLAWKKRSG